MFVKRCAWCGKFTGIKLANFNQWRHWFTATHGICKKCLKKFKEGIKNERH